MAEFTPYEEEQIRILKAQNISHTDIARRLGRRTQDVCDRIHAMELVNCDCCHRNTPREYAAVYSMDNGEDKTLCAACGAVVDWVASFADE